MKNLVYILLALLLFSSCEKEIEIELPAASEKIVVEGYIEQNSPPIIYLSRSISYFEPTDLETILRSFIHDAKVTVGDGTNSVVLDEICASQLPAAQLPLIAQLIGIDVQALAEFDYCIYTTLNPLLFGKIGNTYTLEVIDGEDTVRSQTKINAPPILDSSWFQLYTGEDANGFAYSKFNEPSPAGHAYRWFSKRISTYSDGTQKDLTYLPPFGSAFDDRFIDGITFDIIYGRGEVANSSKPDDSGQESGWYHINDTIVIKFTSVDQAVVDFFRSYDTDVSSNGNPFAAPSNVKTNISNGLGVWAGYGFVLDTIYPAK